MTRETIERREMFPKDGSNATRTGSPGMPFRTGGQRRKRPRKNCIETIETTIRLEPAVDGINAPRKSITRKFETNA
jgi:hypothetical protein